MIHVPLVMMALVVQAAVPAADQFKQPYGERAFHPGALWLDDKGTHINAHGGGMLFHSGVYYWFGEHKTQGYEGNRAQVGVHVYSSPDLYNWKDGGIALPVSSDPASEIAKGCIIERPKVIFNKKTGNFVMWFHLELKGKGYGSARSGVAVADEPCGPYRYLGSFRPNAGVWPDNFPEGQRKPLSREELEHLKLRSNAAPGVDGLSLRRDFKGGQMARDMTLFVDDDGAAYQVYASEDNATIHISRLADDYLSPAGKYIRVFPGKFNEAPALFKRSGKYYLITSGCTWWNPNAARLACADSVMGPWTELGNPCVGTEAERKTTFHSQSTYVLPVAGKDGTFIFMADRWRPKDAVDGRYIWLPVQFDATGKPFLKWMERWELNGDKPR